MPFILTKDQKRLFQITLTGISESSLELIHNHSDTLLKLVEPIVDQLYENVYKIEHLKDIINKYSSLDRLKITQKEYLKQVFTPVIDDRYIQDRFQIGKTHSKVGLELDWYISTSQQYIKLITKNLIKCYSADKALALSDAIQSLLNFDLQITVDAYNKIEIDKAEFPLRYEFKKLQIKSGFVEEDLAILDKYSGKLTFRIGEVMGSFEKALFDRSIYMYTDVNDAQNFIIYFKRFLAQFFQERVYRDESAFYRILRDWVRVLVKKNVSDQSVTALIDILNEVLREMFVVKSRSFTKEHLLFLASFERLSRFSLAIIKELLAPYRSFNNYHFLNIYSYEIDHIDFGKITWVDKNAKDLLISRGIKENEIVGKRCFELFYDRIFPCTGCPVRNNSNEAFLTTYDHGTSISYYKTWSLQQSKMVEISNKLLVSQDVSEESAVIFDTVERLLQLAELRDDMTGKHVDRIGVLSSRLAQLVGCDEKFINSIRLAAKFHDVGKVGIPDSIINKPGKLTKEEWESIKTHPTIGKQILENLDLPVIQMAARIAETHHEKWNGEGYPNQLKGKEIPLEGRIVAIVDVFDALLTKRAYKDPFPEEKVKEIMIEGKGVHFDPELLEIFISMWDEFLKLQKGNQEGKNLKVLKPIDIIK